MDSNIRVRFAPSPTGHLHIGGARTALFNYLFARQHGGTFVLRLEDTDQERSTEESVEMILSDLRWLGLDWDEGPGVGGPHGPYRQTECLDLYQQQIQKLLSNGHAYRCFCTPEELEVKREAAQAANQTPRYDGTCRSLTSAEAEKKLAQHTPFTVRLKAAQQGSIILHDLIRGEIVFDNSAIDDFILQRSNGLPTYNFVVVVDDARMQITHIIRGDDHLSNTPKQIAIYQALGLRVPQLAHVSMILGPDKTRLSKRHGATSVGAYAQDGYLAEAMLNYLALLGWSHDDKTTKFSRAELIEKFSLEKVNKAAAVFDPAKLLWLNGVYLRELPPATYQQQAIAALQRAGLVEPTPTPERLAWLGPVVALFQEKIKTLGELPAAAGFFFVEQVNPEDDKTREKLAELKNYPELFKALQEKLKVLESFSLKNLEEVMQELLALHNQKFGVLAQPLRAALTGKLQSPGILEIMACLGKVATLNRLERALANQGM